MTSLLPRETVQTSAAAAAVAFGDGNSPMNQASWQYIAVSWNTAGTACDNAFDILVPDQGDAFGSARALPPSPPPPLLGAMDSGITISIVIARLACRHYYLDALLYTVQY